VHIFAMRRWPPDVGTPSPAAHGDPIERVRALRSALHKVDVAVRKRQPIIPGDALHDEIIDVLGVD